MEKNRQSIRSNGSSAVQTLLRNCSPSITELNMPTPTRRRYTDSIFSVSSTQSNNLWEFKDDSTSAETISLRSDRKFQRILNKFLFSIKKNALRAISFLGYTSQIAPIHEQRKRQHGTLILSKYSISFAYFVMIVLLP